MIYTHFKLLDAILQNTERAAWANAIEKNWIDGQYYAVSLA